MQEKRQQESGQNVEPPVDRIFALADIAYQEQKDFASAIGVHPARLSEWKAGRSRSWRKCIAEIARCLNTSTEYLLTGEGPAQKDGSPPPQGDELPPEWFGLTAEEKANAVEHMRLLIRARGK